MNFIVKNGTEYQPFFAITADLVFTMLSGFPLEDHGNAVEVLVSKRIAIMAIQQNYA